jgi:hypothetical protein
MILKRASSALNPPLKHDGTPVADGVNILARVPPNKCDFFMSVGALWRDILVWRAFRRFTPHPLPSRQTAGFSREACFAHAIIAEHSPDENFLMSVVNSD